MDAVIPEVDPRQYRGNFNKPGNVDARKTLRRSITRSRKVQGINPRSARSRKDYQRTLSSKKAWATRRKKYGKKGHR